MNRPIENCPQPETPIRERAYTPEQLDRHAKHCDAVEEHDAARMLRAYATTLRQQAERPMHTVASVRAELVAKIGDCCMGGDPLCAGGCLAEKAAAKNAASELAALAQNTQGEVVEMSPEFTDSARGAISWVLWHHQGGSSPIGQPLRFALGMDAHERLPDWRIAEAKRWAKAFGASTEQFHAERARVPDGWVLVPREPTEAMGVAYLEAARIHAASGAEDAMRFSPGGYSAMLAARPSQPEESDHDK